jgi:hypothetical protein
MKDINVLILLTSPANFAKRSTKESIVQMNSLVRFVSKNADFV